MRIYVFVLNKRIFIAVDARDGRNVILDVGGERFIATREVLLAFPATRLNQNLQTRIWNARKVSINDVKIFAVCIINSLCRFLLKNFQRFDFLDWAN